MADESGSAPGARTVGPGEGTAYWFLTDLYAAKLVSGDTEGAFSLFELTAAPQSPAIPHMHGREDELYYVLEGELEFGDGDRTFRAGPGSLVCLPRNRFHSHRNPGDSVARALVFFRPAGIENFLAEAGRPADDPSALPPPVGEADLQRVRAAAPKHGFETPPQPVG